MKLSETTINILKNFATINPSILITEGSVLRTMSPNKSVLAIAKVEEKFTQTFGIYDVNRFISTLSLFNEPELSFTDKSVIISNDSKSVVEYTFCEPELIIQPMAKDPKLPKVDVSVVLPELVLKNVEKALGILSLPEFVITGDGEKIMIQANDTKVKTSHVYSTELGKTTDKFTAIFKIENLKVLPGDYVVDISRQRISQFKGTLADYYIAIEQHSHFF